MSLVSIIMPVYNTEKFLRDAIDSVIGQTHQEWELLIVNDGSTDGSAQIVGDYDDSRIKYFEQENKGVSAARNVGLSKMRGDYFCFLDADDVMPKNSLRARLRIFNKDDSVAYVDGKVQRFSSTPEEIIDTWEPRFHGYPLSDLICLTGRSFLGVTWMIKRNENQAYRMQEGLTHGEDLLFYIEMVVESSLNYSYTNEVVLQNRLHGSSAMKNLEGLKCGYHFIYKKLVENQSINELDIKTYRRRVNRILFLSYIKKMAPVRAVKSLI